MAAVMETEILDTGSHDGLIEHLGATVGLCRPQAGAEHQGSAALGILGGELEQFVEHHGQQNQTTGIAILGFHVQAVLTDASLATGQVNITPAQTQQFATARTGCECHEHKQVEARPSGLAAGSQQAITFIVFEVAHPPPALLVLLDKLGR